MKRTIIKRIFSLAPYLATITGMYIYSNAFVALFLYHLCLAIAIIMFRTEIPFSTLFNTENKTLLIIAIILCALAGSIVWISRPFIKQPHITAAHQLATFGLSHSSLFLFLIYFSTIHPVLEELYRRFVLPSSSSHISRSDLLFASYHVLVLLFFLQPYYALLAIPALATVAWIWRHIKNVLHSP